MSERVKEKEIRRREERRRGRRMKTERRRQDEKKKKRTLAVSLVGRVVLELTCCGLQQKAIGR